MENINSGWLSSGKLVAPKEDNIQQKKVEEKDAVIDGKNAVIDEQSTVIDRISAENEALKKQLQELARA